MARLAPSVAIAHAWHASPAGQPTKIGSKTIRNHIDVHRLYQEYITHKNLEIALKKWKMGNGAIITAGNRWYSGT